ncbi:MAG: hypothetical protein K6G26_04200 [Lachnospiraceae bacterium]|nr:hypothetical protein [Lachnospiraceae bacterium]
MKTNSRYFMVFMAALVLICSGCTKKYETQISSVTKSKIVHNKINIEDYITEDGISDEAPLLYVQDELIEYKDIQLYLLYEKQKYENIFGKEVWNIKFSDDKTFEDFVKEEALNQVVKHKIVAYGAEINNVSLEPGEQIDIENEVHNYMTNFTKEDIKKYDITREKVRQIVYDNYLTEKVYDIVTMDVDINVDENEKDPESVIEKRQDEMFAKEYTKWFDEVDIVIVSQIWKKVNIIQ